MDARSRQRPLFICFVEEFGNEDVLEIDWPVRVQPAGIKHLLIGVLVFLRRGPAVSGVNALIRGKDLVENVFIPGLELAWQEVDDLLIPGVVQPFHSFHKCIDVVLDETAMGPDGHSRQWSSPPPAPLARHRRRLPGGGCVYRSPAG